MKPIKNIVTVPAMTREEYNELPPAVRYFIPWNKVCKPLRVRRVGPPAKARNPEGYRCFTDGKQ